MDKVDIRMAKDSLAEIVAWCGFVNEPNAYTIRNLDKDGFDISCMIGAKYDSKKGLIVWNKSQKYAGGTISIKDLENLESKLKKEFDSIWGN